VMNFLYGLNYPVRPLHSIQCVSLLDQLFTPIL
jgi:hypothetical protein